MRNNGVKSIWTIKIVLKVAQKKGMPTTDNSHIEKEIVFRVFMCRARMASSPMNHQLLLFKYIDLFKCSLMKCIFCSVTMLLMSSSSLLSLMLLMLLASYLRPLIHLIFLRMMFKVIFRATALQTNEKVLVLWMLCDDAIIAFACNFCCISF